MSKEIRIPFNAWSRERLRTHGKCATSRTKKYGEPGDWFEVDGMRFKLWATTTQPLKDVRDHHWRDEGCESPREFEVVWKSIHPRAGFKHDKVVWLHEFEQVKP